MMRCPLIKRNLPPALEERLRNGLPKAAFYLGLFYLSFLLFGPDYGFVTAAVGAAFDFHYQKRLTSREILILAASQMFICGLACLASLNIILRLSLNALFPIVWTSLHSSPFNNKGYYVGMVTFVFLQLIPIEREDIPMLMGVMAFAIVVLILILALLQPFKAPVLDDTMIRDGLRLMANQLRAENPDAEAVRSVEHSLYRMAYNGHNIMHITHGGEHVYYAFALVFQRAAYYLSDRRPLPADAEARQRLAAYMEKAASEINQQDNRSLIQEAEQLLKQGENLNARFGTFYRNALRLLSMALREMTEGTAHREHFHFYRYFQDLRNHIELNGFEMRFAFRLSLVMTVSFAWMHWLDSERSYWLAMNAFIIIQPMYKDSIIRVQTRMIGSVVGCALAYGVYAFFPHSIALYIYFSAMTVGMYLSTPGKWVQPFYATTGAVAMASITLGSGAAVGYRMIYLVMATLLVFLVNRFIFPSTGDKKFRFNLRELYRMQRYYLSVLETGLYHRVSLTVLHNTLLNFHLLCGEVRNYISTSIPEDVREQCETLLLLLWRMVAEAEQMIVLIHTERLTDEERESAAAFFRQAQAVLAERGTVVNEIEAPDVPSVMFFNDLAQRYGRNLLQVQQILQSLLGYSATAMKAAQQTPKK